MKLKTLPWIAIVRSAALTVITWAIVSAALWFAAQSFPAIETVFSLFLRQPMNLISNLGIGILLGVLAFTLLDNSEGRLTVPMMWFLVLAVTVGMVFYEYVPIRLYRLLAVNFNQPTLVGLVLGVFWKGRRYWR
ncbi:hypothetical protein [Lyngbya confervoides]|uniref:Peptide chain release factor 1 n=1 Tax=Lyngbya confervoides BDU141951 TaxID=1574623 RepID=A0ABD4T723_9CYAN|nr:hypothetical protein [Lyngbya confervoides]MCM1984542.1 hypothetical protein [Lyngbya confervoides BDU141951]